MENPQSEPSMEEILASIRRIISEDDEDAPAKPEASKPALVQKAETQQEKPAAPRAAPAPARDEDTAKSRLETEDVEMVKKNTPPAAQDGDNAMLDSSSAAAASQAFQALSQSVKVNDGGPGQTLEDIVTAMLRPMIKEWLDANLPAIVEEKVEEEVQRVARRRG